MSHNQFLRHKRAKERLKTLFDRPDRVLVIHYSCESFYDREDGSSPRITSIAVRNLKSAQTNSFSIHRLAEIEGYSRDEIEAHYDDLEREMLDEFSAFLGRHEDYAWLHWNMRDENYGFQAIAHRHRVLGGKPVAVSDGRKHDLARILYQLYGKGYIGHKRFEKIVEKNDMTPLHFLNGEEEAKAFEEKRYLDLHRSTLSKVGTISHLAEAALDNKLKHNAGWFSSRGFSFETAAYIVQEHPAYAVLSVLATIGGISWLAGGFAPILQMLSEVLAATP